MSTAISPTQPSPTQASTLAAASPGGRVLIVDDNRPARLSMADVLSHGGYHVDCLSSGIEALQTLTGESYDIVITDLKMPGMNGLEFIRQLQSMRHGAQIIMVTAFASVESAVEAMRLGAFDYIEKPFSAEQLENLVTRAFSHGQMLDRRHQTATSSGGGAMVGQSSAMQTLSRRITQVAPTPETVLIHGESGTGKELVARAIHAESGRADSSLVSLNCPVLSAQLMESELFGHERGAFTGADAPRTGRFELADSGTILLDEVSEIDLNLQAKLLRVLQERCFERVGSSATIHVDVRVLATTNRHLLDEVEAGQFRQDLYYRLAVVPIHVPSLRERAEDISLLVDHFLEQAGRRLQREPATLAPSTYDLLVHYNWPGNIRELENVAARASVMFTSAAITPDDLRPWLIDPTGKQDSAPEESLPVGLSLQEMEQKLIESTLERFGGHRAQTAEALGIGIRTLSGKLKQYGYAPRAKVSSKAA